MAEAIDNKIYVIGGADYSQGEQKDTVEVYYTTTDRWVTDVKPIPIALDHGATASYLLQIGHIIPRLIHGPKRHQCLLQDTMLLPL